MGEAGALSGHIAETTGSPPAAGLAPPSGLWFTGITDTSISLSWTETSGATGYKVYRSLSASGAFAHAGSTGGFSQTSFTDTGLASGTIYYYKVSSIDTGGESPMSAVVGNKTSVPEAAQGSVPPAPAGLSIAEVTSGSISLSWTAVSGASYYKIYRADSASGTYIQAGLSDVNSYTNYALTPNTTYYYKISAVNDTGESAQSGAVFGTTTSSAGTQSVTQLNLSGIVAAPEENDTPQTAPNALSHNQYTITALTWQTDSGGAVSGAFAAGIVYKVTLSLQAQGAYTFSGIGVDAFTCNGANSVTAAIAGQMATVTITFPVTKSNVILPDATTANDFITRLNEIKNNGVPDTIYAIPLTSDISIAPQILNASYDSALRNTTIRIVGDINERTITLNSDGSLFTLQGQSEANKFTFVLGNNIKLRGKSSNTASVVRVNNYAEFIMEGGAICGNTVSAVAETYALAGGVAVYNGTFTMAGGIISGNTARASTTVYNGRSAYGGGVYVGGTFIMLGGTISGNSASASSSAPCTAYGGGVYAGGGTFIMSGGTISGNSASAITPYGGGVYIDGTCAFIKTGDSIIYGNDADASLKNTASNGAAVYVNSGSKKRNSTAYASDTMDSNLSGAAGGWE
jgi:hypothetical protein